MKAPDQDGADRKLKTLLSSWNPPPLPPRFRERVWRGIAQVEASDRNARTILEYCRAWLRDRLARPVIAWSCASLLLVVGIGLGWVQARHHATTVTAELAVRYARSVDPYQTHPTLP